MPTDCAVSGSFAYTARESVGRFFPVFGAPMLEAPLAKELGGRYTVRTTTRFWGESQLCFHFLCKCEYQANGAMRFK